MIDYNELDRFYIGTCIPVIANAGGGLLELGKDINTVFYKIDEDYYVDINSNIKAQIYRGDKAVNAKYIIPENSLTQVKTKRDITKNSSLIKRYKFNSSNYKNN